MPNLTQEEMQKQKKYENIYEDMEEGNLSNGPGSKKQQKTFEQTYENMLNEQDQETSQIQEGQSLSKPNKTLPDKLYIAVDWKNQRVRGPIFNKEKALQLHEKKGWDPIQLNVDKE